MTLLLRTALLAADGGVAGQLADPQGKPVPGASLRLSGGAGAAKVSAASDADGRFAFRALAPGEYTLGASAADFEPVARTVHLAEGESLTVDLKFARLASRHDAVTVTADVSQLDVLSPDPTEKVFASENLLDANPGRPGAPISIPGYPIETASSGIKAPQYFAPGVAGDHGEPIAQYVQVGTYLVPNNLSANAHGNGYSDPNIYIANVIESVQVDGGAYNVREGNHALNLAAIYGLRSHLDPFLTLTGDYRDITTTAGMSPSANSWVAMEGSFGNGFLDRLEHRKQFKFNGGRVFHAQDHTLTLFGIAYLGYGFVAGLGRCMDSTPSMPPPAGWSIRIRSIRDKRIRRTRRSWR